MLHRIDDWLLSWATAIGWWLEVHYDNAARYYGRKLIIWGNIFAVAASVDGIVLCVSQDYILLAFFWLLPLAHHIVTVIVYHNDLFFDAFHPKGSPNPARIKDFHYRMASVAVTLLWLISLGVKLLFFFTTAESDIRPLPVFFSIGFLLLTIGLYLVATDDMPPSEKQRRKAAAEAYNDTAVPVGAGA